MPKRFVVALCVALVAWSIPLGVSATIDAKPSAPMLAPGLVRQLSTAAGVQAYARTYAPAIKQFQADLAHAKPFLSQDAAGYFVVAPGYQPLAGGLDLAKRLGRLNAERRADLAGMGRPEAPGVTAALAYGCIYVPSWALWWAGYTFQIFGSVVMGMSVGVDGTIVGLPIGGVMLALGILWVLYAGLLEFAATYWYPNGLSACGWWLAPFGYAMGYFYDGVQQLWVWYQS